MIAPLVPRRDPFWTESKRELDRARRELRRSPVEAAPKLAAYLERLAACASAAKDRRLERRANRAARPLARLRAIEIDREILSRLVEKRIFAREAAAGLEVLWEEKSRMRLEKARRKLD